MIKFKSNGKMKRIKNFKLRIIRSIHILFIINLTNGLHSNEYIVSKIYVENMITEQLSAELSRFLPDDSFIIFTSAKLEVTKQRELLEGEVLKKSPLGENKLPPVPGFRELPGLSGFKGKINEREIYSMVSKERITQLLVKVIFSKKLPENNINTAKTIVNDKLISSLGNIVKINFIVDDLPSKELSPSDIFTKGDDLLSTLSPYWPYILMGLGFLLLLLLFSRRRKTPDINKLAEQEFARSDLTQKEDAAKSDLIEYMEQNNLDQTVDEFVSEISQEPIVSRKFLTQLDEQGQKVIYSTLKTHPLKNILSQYLLLGKIRTEETDKPPIKEQVAGLKNMTNELKNFKKVSAAKLQNPFGMLSFLSDMELQKLFAGKHFAEVYTMFEHLTREQIKQVVDILPVQDRESLISLLKDNQKIPNDKRESILKKMQKEIQKIANELKSDFSSSHNIIEVIIDTLQDDEEKLRKILSSDKELSEKYSYYLLKIEDVLGLEPEILAQGIENISNQSIALVCNGISEEEKKKILSIIPASRKDIINSLQLTLKDTSPDIIQQEIKSFIRTFQEELKIART